MSKTRAEAFSDGVFAVAATLLVFNLIIPDVKQGLTQALLNEWPSYAAYAVSFATIVVIWVNHHAVTDLITRFDTRLLFINGLLLMTIAAIPFPTGLLAHYLQAGHDQNTAAFAYGLTMSAMSIAFSAFSMYARRYRRVRLPIYWLAFITGLALWPVATLVSVFSVNVALALYAFTAIFYVVLPILRENRSVPVRSGE